MLSDNQRLVGSVMRPIMNMLKSFVAHEDGAALVEYGMLLLLIALLVVIALKNLGSKVSNGFESANTLLP